MTTTDEFKPFLINDRSSALLHLVDAFQFTESESVDLYLGLCDRLKHLIDLQPSIRFEVKPTVKDIKQTFDGLKTECDTDEKLLFEVQPLEAYMLLGMMQAAIVSLGLPENLEKFGRRFINAFCDRYRIKFPDLVKSLEMGWTTCTTSEEFDALLDSEDDDLSVEDFLNSDVLIRVGDDFVNHDHMDTFTGVHGQRNNDDYVDDFENAQDCRSTYVDDFE